MIAHMRDSLSQASPAFEEEKRTGQEALDEALEEFSGVISSLSRELAELDLDIDDQTISLRDKDGGGIEINIPDDLGDQISKGISSITQVILSELPDTLSLSRAAEKWQHVINVPPTPERRRVIGGDAVKIWDDIEITTEEDVRGCVVAVFGDATIEGRVTGDVVVVFGDLDLGATAEVLGQVVTIFGRMDRHEESTVRGSEFVLDPYFTRDFGGIRELFAGDWLAFLARQVIFVVVVFCVMLLVLIFPAERLVNVQQALVQNPVGCLGYGVLTTLLGHIGLTILFGVLVLTVIGIPLALLLLLAVLFLGLLAVAIVSLEVGRWACRVVHASCNQKWLMALVGLLILHSLTFIGNLLGLPDRLAPVGLFFGILGLGVKLVVYCFGIGALVLSKFGSRSPAAPAAEPVAQT